MTTMCIGLGMGATVIWENPHHADYGTEAPSIEMHNAAAKHAETTTTETGATA
jgi:acetyl-CoA acyltransferase